MGGRSARGVSLTAGAGAWRGQRFAGAPSSGRDELSVGHEGDLSCHKAVISWWCLQWNMPVDSSNLRS